MSEPLVAVLEVGGTHVTAAHLDTRSWRPDAPVVRLALDSAATARQILETIARAGLALGPARGLAWGVAVPDPFDYAHGVGRFRGVGKFEALDGVDVRAALTRALPTPASIRFVNDADAFTLGEARHGTAAGFRRCVGLTLGTGVGSGWVVDGRVVAAGPGIPPGGRLHQLRTGARPLEQVMSRRAIRCRYADATGDSTADVREIADRAGAGEDTARAVLTRALHGLGVTLAPCLREFAAEILVVGGSMAASWALFEPWFRDALGEAATGLVIATSPDAELAALRGAAHVALGR
jgi:glucokinase